MRIGVVGAGISGLVCARRLLELSLITKAPDLLLQVTTLEWGRGPGGRTARRRVTLERSACGKDENDDLPQQQHIKQNKDSGKAIEVSFDHAAPFFTARTKEFRDGLLAQWEASGFASKWSACSSTATTEDEELWVGVPSNHAIARGIVSEIEEAGGSCLFGQDVQAAKFDDKERVWTVRSSDRNAPSAEDELHTFDVLVLSDKLLVLPNTYAILDPSDWGNLALPPDLGSTGAVVLLIALYNQPTVTTSMEGVHRLTPNEHPFLKTIIHDSAKPGRGGEGSSSEYDLWVVHSTHEYAASHLVGEQLDDMEAVKAEMTDAFLAVLGSGTLPRIAHTSVMAWDHARPDESKRLAAHYLLDEQRRVGVCGDFFLGRESDDCATGPEGVEAAALSGLSLANKLASLLL